MVAPAFVHVGLPKTATTYLQATLWRNRGLLRSQGLLLPGDQLSRHWLGAMDLGGAGFAGYRIPGTEGSWSMLVEEAKAWPGAVLISHEILSGMGPRHLRRLAEDLAPRPVHVVITLRDLSRVIPATWQERAKNGRIERWDEFVASVSRGPRVKRRHQVWHTQDAAGIIQRWAGIVGGENVHVVTVPPTGGDGQVLLQRFCAALGVESSGFSDVPRAANESIGAVEVRLLQSLNRFIDDGIEFEDYLRLIKHRLVPGRLAQRSGTTPIRLDQAARSWIEPELGRIAALVDELGCHVHGDFEDLEPRALVDSAQPGMRSPDDVTAEEALGLAAELILEMARELDHGRDLSRFQRWLQQRLDRHTSGDSRLRRVALRLGERAKRASESHRGVDQS